MYANTNYKAIYINIVMFTKQNAHQIAFTFQFGKLNVCQQYRVYMQYPVIAWELNSNHSKLRNYTNVKN